MVGICYRYTYDRELAEDLAQDAFVTAMEKAGDFEGRGSFEGWIRRITVNTSLQFLREKFRENYLKELLPKDESAVEIIEQNTSDTSGFSLEELLELVSQLPPHHRLVFNMYVLDNFSHAQIAAELGISEGTSKSHLARARKKLRELLKRKIQSDEKKRQRLFFIFAFPVHRFGIDKVWKKAFKTFELTTSRPFPATDSSAIPVWKNLGVLPGNYLHMAVTLFLAGAAVTTFLYLKRANNPNASQLTEKDLAIPDIIEETPILDSLTSAPATFSENPILAHEQLNQTKEDTMKKSTVLGALLISGSALAQQPVNEIKSPPLPAIRPSLTLLGNGNFMASVANESPKMILDRDETGTFYATSLEWVEKGQSLYFYGDIVVSFADNSFVAKGSVNFLDAVHYLLLNGKALKPGDKIKLEKKKYRIRQLSEKTATKKYGDAGKRGAIEIEMTDEE